MVIAINKMLVNAYLSVLLGLCTRTDRWHESFVGITQFSDCYRLLRLNYAAQTIFKSFRSNVRQSRPKEADLKCPPLHTYVGPTC